MAQIIIPTPLRKFTNNESTFETNETTVLAGIRELSQRYPALEQHLFDEGGKFRTFINIFVEEDDIRGLERENTAIESNTTVSIIPAIAGGSY